MQYQRFTSLGIEKYWAEKGEAFPGLDVAVSTTFSSISMFQIYGTFELSHSAHLRVQTHWNIPKTNNAPVYLGQGRRARRRIG